MNKLSNKIVILITAILFWAVVGAFLFVYKYYLLTVLCLILLIYTGYVLYKLNIKTTSHFKLFADSIKFSENNISIINRISDDAYLDYYNSLKKALDRINIQTQKCEADNSFYNILLNRIDFALIVTNKTGQVIWINKIALDLLGRPKPLDLEVIKKLSAEFKEIFESIQPKSSKILKLEWDGKVKNLMVNLSTINIMGEAYFIYSMKDVQLVVDETENIAWQQLIRVLTHEIMNSLTPIISLSENLSRNESDYELLVKAMDTIHRRSKGLVSFIDNYKKLTQIPPPQLTNVNMRSLVDDIANLMKGHGVELHTLVTSPNLISHIDRGQIEQVLINIIKNAQESCSNTSVPCIKLTVTDNEHKQMIIAVSDNGAGMDPDVLEKIFTPFYTTKPGGSGIGLSICRQIITMHGGTLTASSILGEGSIFTIRI